MAKSRQHSTGTVGLPRQGERRTASVMAPQAWRLLVAANDNTAPLSRRLRHLLFAVTSAATVGWLFWLGVLR